MNIVEEVSKDFGGQQQLAEFLGVRPQAVTPWLREGSFPPGRAIQLERSSRGKYKATTLHPEHEVPPEKAAA